mgnify:CR=1 FL=1
MVIREASRSSAAVIFAIALLTLTVGASILLLNNIQVEIDEPTEKVRKLVIEYIRQKHPEAIAFVGENLTWILEKQISAETGVEEYVYINGSCKVKICRASSIHLSYDVEMTYDGGIFWIGKVENDKVIEMRYKFSIGGEGEKMDVKILVLEYIRRHHPDAASLIGDPYKINWTKKSSEIKVGYSKTVYVYDDWELSIGQATTAELTYEVEVKNVKEGIIWVGTVSNRTVKESSYSHFKSR